MFRANGWPRRPALYPPPSLLALLRGGAGSALSQATWEATDNPDAALAVGLLPLLWGGIHPTRKLLGIGAVGTSPFKAVKLDLGQLGEGLAYRNPTEQQIDNLAARDKYNAVRWFRDETGDVWAFTGGDIPHDQAAYQLGYADTPKDRGGFITEDGKRLLGDYGSPN